MTHATARLNYAALLEELLAELTAIDGGREMSTTVIAIWDYLVKTPGAQLSLADMGRAHRINGNVQRKLARLTERKIITKTASRRGAGGGTGYVCEWLECRRRGDAKSLAELIDAAETEVTERSDKVVVADAAPYDPDQNDSRGVDGVRSELAWIESAAEHGINAVRQVLGEDSEDGLALEEILRTIQARVSRARRCIAGVV